METKDLRDLVEFDPDEPVRADVFESERLYAPLGMAHTSSRFADYMAEANRAVPHVKEGDTWRVTPQQRDPDAQSPAGGVSSTARDLAQWLRLQLGQGTIGGRQLIPAAALAPALVEVTVTNASSDPAVVLVVAAPPPAPSAEGIR